MRPAGVTSTLAMFPLETVRTRLAVDHRRYMNVPNALRTIAAEEGVLALYRVRFALTFACLGAACLKLRS